MLEAPTMTEKELVAKMFDTLVKSRKELANIDLGITKQMLLELQKVIEHISTPLMIMVMGEFSSGKSTFINAMVGEEVAVVNATPTTAVITKLCYGAYDKILVHFTDGAAKEVAIDYFKQLTAKTGKENEDRTHENIVYVERQMPLDILRHMTIIDSPGLNDINEKHSTTTKDFVNNADTVFWMFNALHACSKTEIDALEGLTPRLKPIAIINMMDEIDEEEDDPKEFLDNLRVQLKDKVQAVVGISAKFALEGKLENNPTKIEIGNLKALEQTVEELVLPFRDRFKLNTLIDELGDWSLNSFYSIQDIQKHNENNRDADYTNYLDIKTKLQINYEVLERMFQPIKDYGIIESKKGNVQSFYLLGLMYYFGIGFESDRNKGIQFIETAALKNHVFAQAALGTLYFLEEDWENAKFWLTKASDQDNKLALTLLGVLYVTGTKKGEFDFAQEKCLKALPLITKAAELGYSDAQYILSTFYLKGLGINVNEEIGEELLIKATNQGNMDALCVLGALKIDRFMTKHSSEDLKFAKECFVKSAYYGNATAMFYLGEIERENKRFKEAVAWYKKAALLGEEDAQNMLGFCYLNGLGIEKNPNLAMEWFQKAAEQGHIVAQSNVGYCYSNGIGVETNYEEAIKWYKYPAEQGDVNAQYALGDCYYTGNGIAQDYQQAVFWYEKAAMQGDAGAQASLGNCYFQGEGLAQNYQLAIKWYEKAALQGNAIAQIGLGYCYQEGFGVANDYQQSFLWYKKAAEQGDAEAQTRLGNCYYYGRGVTKDYDMAAEWYLKAAKQGHDTAKSNLGFLMNSGINTNKVKSTQGAGCLVPMVLIVFIIVLWCLL